MGSEVTFVQSTRISRFGDELGVGNIALDVVNDGGNGQRGTRRDATRPKQFGRGHVAVILCVSRRSRDFSVQARGTWTGTERAMAFRPLATAARKTLRIGLIPADGIGREVIPVSAAIQCGLSIVIRSLQLPAGRSQNVGSVGI